MKISSIDRTMEYQTKLNKPDRSGKPPILLRGLKRIAGPTFIVVQALLF